MGIVGLFRDIFDENKFDRHPYYSFIVAMFFVIVSFLFAMFIFPAEFSMSMLAFATLLMVPYTLKILKKEKPSGKAKASDAFKSFSRHNRLILLFIFLFFGMAIEYMIIFAISPPHVVNMAFSEQMITLTDTPSKYFLNIDFLYKILINNIRLVFISYILSLFYGIGALYILNYNASIVGIVYGNTIRPLIWGGGLTSLAFAKLFLFLPHLITEVIAYLLAAVAGILLMKSLQTKSSVTLTESIVILVGAIVLVFLAGVLEVIVPFLI